MKNFLRLIVLTPIAIAVLAFALANRHSVTVQFDPFAYGDIPAFSITAPLFVILILATGVGVLAGGAATWFAQGKYRKAARQSRTDAERSRSEAQQWRTEAERARAAQGEHAFAPSLSLQRRA